MAVRHLKVLHCNVGIVNNILFFHYLVLLRIFVRLFENEKSCPFPLLNNFPKK